MTEKTKPINTDVVRYGNINKKTEINEDTERSFIVESYVGHV